MAEPAELRFTQAGLFAALAPEPGKLEVALARVRAVVGEEDSRGRPRVGSPVVLDSHCPDGFQVAPFRSTSYKPSQELLPSVPLALRVFRPPLPASVTTEARVPAAVAFKGMKARVITAAGPWRGNGEWWNEQTRWGREQWELMLEGEVVSGLYRFFSRDEIKRMVCRRDV
jgi:protein ImuB